MKLIVTDGAMAMDGGSIVLRTLDSPGVEATLHLDWSFRSQTDGTAQFYADGNAIPRGSGVEANYLTQLQSAIILPGFAATPESDSSLSERRLTLGNDVTDYIGAIDKGSASALAWLTDRLVSIVSSAAYRTCRPEIAPPMAPPTMKEQIRDLLSRGRKTDAIRLQRKLCPEVGIMDAKATVEAIQAESDSPGCARAKGAKDRA